MNLRKHPELIGQLASAYVLGTLRGGARRRFETLAQDDPYIRQAISGWQHRLAAFNELQPEKAPPAHVWPQIVAALPPKTLRRPTPAANGLGAWLSNLNFWRFSSVVAASLAIFAFSATLRLSNELANKPTVTYIAVLHNDRAEEAMLATWDANKQTMVVKRLDALPLQAEQTLQLWGLPTGQTPQSLGLFNEQRALAVQLQQGVQAIPALAVSIEPKGGSRNPKGGPSGPVIYSGKLVSTAI